MYKNAKIAIVGLGYVGMPLALELAKHFDVVGFDVDQGRVTELKAGNDRNKEVGKAELEKSQCRFTFDENDLTGRTVFIVTVPTPLKEPGTDPDLSIVEAASRTVGRHLSKDAIVVYESTVYPGVTEDICGPILSKESGLACGVDFFLGYSPERINPGDTQHTVDKITKVVSGQTPEVTNLLADIYGTTNGGNIFKAKDIKTAEASKVIENAQRDINVAFINEVAQVMNKLGLSVYDVLDAAGTKWNFLPFKPGLVGGHCIGVDPYYLSHCAQALGHDPAVILAGRRINDTMGAYFAEVLDGRLESKESKVLVLGFTFKENINDIRNTKVMDVITSLKQKGHAVEVHDPHADPAQVQAHYGLPVTRKIPDCADFSAVILAVAHSEYREMDEKSVLSIVKPGGVVYDLRGIWRGHDYGGQVAYLTV